MGVVSAMFRRSSFVSLLTVFTWSPLWVCGACTSYQTCKPLYRRPSVRGRSCQVQDSLDRGPQGDRRLVDDRDLGGSHVAHDRERLAPGDQLAEAHREPDLRGLTHPLGDLAHEPGRGT